MFGLVCEPTLVASDLLRAKSKVSLCKHVFVEHCVLPPGAF